MRKPYYKKSHQAWYVDLNGKPVRLGPDKEQAHREYHRIMAAVLPVTSRTTAVELMEQFLDWVQTNQAPETYRWYRLYCEKFAAHLGAKVKVSDLKPIHVTRWLAKFTCTDNGKNGAARAVARAFNWAQKQGLIASSPIAGMERPAAAPRDVYLEEADWKKALTEVKASDPFYDIAVFLRATGCRPVEARIVQACHWDRKETLVFERKNSKGKKIKRVIRLNSVAQGVVRKLALAHPDGPLFLNRRGRPWTTTGLNQAFLVVAEKTGLPVFPYVLRHSWCTDALLRGVDPLTVSVLMGHKDATMVMRVYSHLTQQNEFLKKKVKQATGEAV